VANRGNVSLRQVEAVELMCAQRDFLSEFTLPGHADTNHRVDGQDY
jgi:hypothetical protein